MGTIWKSVCSTAWQTVPSNQHRSICHIIDTRWDGKPLATRFPEDGKQLTSICFLKKRICRSLLSLVRYISMFITLTTTDQSTWWSGPEPADHSEVTKSFFISQGLGSQGPPPVFLPHLLGKEQVLPCSSLEMLEVEPYYLKNELYEEVEDLWTQRSKPYTLYVKD